MAIGSPSMNGKIGMMPPSELPARLCDGHCSHERHRASSRTVHSKLLRAGRHPLGTMRLCRLWNQDRFRNVILLLATLASTHVQGTIGKALQRVLDMASWIIGDMMAENDIAVGLYPTKCPCRVGCSLDLSE